MKRIIAAPFLMFILFVTLHAQQQDPGPPRVIRKSGGVLQEEAITKVSPVYPPLARAAKVEGQVVVELTIDEEGNVIKTKVVSGHPFLKDAAQQAAQGWKFKPTKLSGIAVKVIGNITFNFALNNAPQNAKEIDSLEKEVRKNPGSADARYELGAAYYGSARFDVSASM